MPSVGAAGRWAVVPPTRRMVCWAATVTDPLKVLSPANACVPVDTIPGLVASAVCKNKVVLLMTAPLADLAWPLIAPIVSTPEPGPPGLNGLHVTLSPSAVIASPGSHAAG